MQSGDSSSIQARELSQLGGSPRIHAGEERFIALKKRPH